MKADSVGSPLTRSWPREGSQLGSRRERRLLRGVMGTITWGPWGAAGTGGREGRPSHHADSMATPPMSGGLW